MQMLSVLYVDNETEGISEREHQRGDSVVDCAFDKYQHDRHKHFEMRFKQFNINQNRTLFQHVFRLK